MSDNTFQIVLNMSDGRRFPVNVSMPDSNIDTTNFIKAKDTGDGHISLLNVGSANGKVLATMDDLSNVQLNSGALSSVQANATQALTNANNALTNSNNALSSISTLSNQVAASNLPVGTIVPYSNNNIPAGFMLCNGASFDQSKYPDLYTAVGNTNVLPDMRGMFLRGLDTSGSVDRDGKVRNLLSFQEGTRQFLDGVNHYSGMYAANQNDGSNTMSNLGLDPLASSTETHTLCWSGVGGTESVGASNSNNQPSQQAGLTWDMISVSRPKNVAVNYIIKATSSGTTAGSTSVSPIGTGGTTSSNITLASSNSSTNLVTTPSVLFSTNNTSASIYSQEDGNGNTLINIGGNTGTASWNGWTFNATQGFITTPMGNVIPEVYGAQGRMVIQAWHMEQLNNTQTINFPKAFAASNPRYQIIVNVSVCHWNSSGQETSVPYVHYDQINNTNFFFDRSTSGFSNNAYNFIAIGPM